MNMAAKSLIWVRGAGELASAVAHLLQRLGYPLFLSEREPPLAIRRSVTFSDAILEGSTTVDGITAAFYDRYTLPDTLPGAVIPLYRDDPEQLRRLGAKILVDGRMLKRDIGDARTWAEYVIGMGPGFHTGQNCHAVIETMRGHDLGRVITAGSASEDTGIPGRIGGQTSQRLIRASRCGQVQWQVDFGQLVEAGQVIGLIDQGMPIHAPISGLIRGLISEHSSVIKGLKIGDVDPRGSAVNHLKISDKARMIASGVLESILLWEQAQPL